MRFALHEGHELTLQSRLANGTLRQFRASVAMQNGQGLEPRFLAIADGSCIVRSAREIRNGSPPWRFLDQLDGDLKTLRWTETLQAPWPPGEDAGGVRIGLVDSGLAYDLPLFRDRLARNADGVPVGYDYWILIRGPTTEIPVPWCLSPDPSRNRGRLDRCARSTRGSTGSLSLSKTRHGAHGRTGWRCSRKWCENPRHAPWQQEIRGLGRICGCPQGSGYPGNRVCGK